MPTFARPDGPPIGYSDTGGDGPPVLLSHGLLMDRSMFDPQIAALTPAYRCIAWDERGHGETPAPEPFSYWDSARDLLALMDHLAVEHAVLVGMSQGGFLSLRAALLAPDRVAGLVFLDSQAGLEPPGAEEAYRSMASDWSTNGPRREIADLVATIIIGPDGHDEWVQKWLARPKEAVVEPFETLVGRDDLTDRLGEIDAPALVVHGTADQAIPMERAEALAAGLPGCRGLVRVEGGAHAANLTHPDQVNAALRTFLDQVTAGRS